MALEPLSTSSCSLPFLSPLVCLLSTTGAFPTEPLRLPNQLCEEIESLVAPLSWNQKLISVLLGHRISLHKEREERFLGSVCHGNPVWSKAALIISGLRASVLLNTALKSLWDPLYCDSEPSSLWYNQMTLCL